MKRLFLYMAAGLILVSCAPSFRVRRLREAQVSAQLSLSDESRELPALEMEQAVVKDTMVVEDPEGNQVLIMRAVKDENGEMVAHDEIQAAKVTARFRHVAERGGRVDLRFQIRVPQQMQDSRWQLRFFPDMFILEDSLRLDPVIITGRQYRQAQLRGYEQYERFIRSIITDSTLFVDRRSLEIFLERNIPQIYRFKADTAYVSEDQFQSMFGVTGRDALVHYTNEFSKRMNERRKARRQQMYDKYVKVPIVKDGIRLDTVLQSVDGDFVYEYVQTIFTRPRLKKADIVLSGDVYEGDRKLYSMNRSEPLTFYISSLSSFVDPTERYRMKIVERRVSAQTACYVDFHAGDDRVDPTHGNNREELFRIRENLVDLLGNDAFEMDSIVIAASASPEGRELANLALSRRRAASVAAYFGGVVEHYRDSVRRILDLETGKPVFREQDLPRISFISRSAGENWAMLTRLVEGDSLLTESQIRSYLAALEIPDVDRREEALRNEPFYRHLREQLYPRLRTVRFGFHLHRRGMVQDTVHTTELDTVYMRGVQALKERDYQTALTFLRPYRDYNTAIAYLSLDYNASARDILKDLPLTPQVHYMLAILDARAGDHQQAVQHYLDACSQDRSFVFRGNLDPEISALIRLYALHDNNSF